MVFIIVSGGPGEDVFSKYFSSYEEAENLLLDNSFIKNIDSLGMIGYHHEDWDDEFNIDGEEVGFQAYIQELSSYNKRSRVLHFRNTKRNFI